MSMMSEQVDQLFTALSKAQGKFTVAEFDKTNPHFKSKYATLQSYFNASRRQLSENGLCVLQTMGDLDNKPVVFTLLGHSSGQWIRSITPVNASKNDMQGFGSALSYSKRYAYGSIIGLASGEEDDDANDACEPGVHKPQITPYVAAETKSEAPVDNRILATQDQLKELMVLINQCSKEFVAQWLDTLKKPPHNCKKGFADIPANIYEKVKDSANVFIANAKKGAANA